MIPILEAPWNFRDFFGCDMGAWFIFHELHNLIVMIMTINVMSHKGLCFFLVLFLLNESSCV